VLSPPVVFSLPKEASEHIVDQTVDKPEQAVSKVVMANDKKLIARFLVSYLVSIPNISSFYNKSSFPKEAQGVFQNILLAEYHGTFHDSP